MANVKFENGKMHLEIRGDVLTGEINSIHRMLDSRLNGLFGDDLTIRKNAQVVAIGALFLKLIETAPAEDQNTYKDLAKKVSDAMTAVPSGLHVQKQAEA